MNSSIVGLIMTGVIALILLSSIFWGITRGLKKTLFRLAWLVGTGIILFFTVPPLSNWLNSFDLSSLNLDICGKVTKLSDIGINLINSFEEGRQALENSASLTGFVEALPTIILNVLLFVVLFWLLKIVLWVIWAPIASRIFDKKKRELKKLRREKKKERKRLKGYEFVKEENEPILLTVKDSKHRAWGALVGFVLGLILCAVTFSPIVGFNAIYQTAYACIKTEDENGNEVAYLSQVLDEETRGYVGSYEDSIGSKILRYSGVEYFSNLMFGSLATVKADGEKISLANEVNAFSKVLNSVESIKKFDGENITKEGVERLILDIRTIFTDVDQSKIVYLLGDNIIPALLNKYLEENKIVLLDGDMIDQVILDAYFRFSEHFDFGVLKSQLVSVLNIANELNNNNLLVPFLNEEVTDINYALNLIGNNVANASNFANKVVDGLYDITILQNDYSKLVCAAIESFFTALDIEYTEQSVDTDKLRNDISTIVQDFVSFCRSYSKSDRLDFDTNTISVMTTTGRILNTVKQGIISEENFSTLIDYAKTEINKALTEIVDLTSIVDSIKSVEDWETELVSLTTIYQSVVKLINAEPTLDGIMAGEFDEQIKKIGKGFDSAITGESVLVNNQNIKTALEAFVAKMDTSSFDELLNIELDDSTTLKQQIYKNIYDTEKNTSQIKKWENEVKYNFELVKLIYNVAVDGFDIEKLSSAQNSQLSKIGEAIDGAIERTKLLLSNKTIRGIFDYYLGTIELPEEVSKILNIEVDVDGKKYTVMQIALNNIYNKSTGEENTFLSYQSELSKLKNVLSVDFENATFVELGAALDNLLGSNILTKDDVINVVVSHYIDEETSSLDSGLQSALSSMKANLKNVTSYAKEMEYIVDLLEILDAEYQTDTQKFSAFGRQFNIMCDYNDTLNTSSKLFTKATLNKFITFYFDDFIGNNLTGISQDIKDIINSVKTNLHLINDYELELVNFLELADYVDGSIIDANNDNNSDIKDIGYYLDRMESDIITPTVIKNLIAYYINQETTSLDAGLKDIVDDIVLVVKNELTVIDSYEEEFDLMLQLVDQVKATEIDCTQIGKVFDDLQANSDIITRLSLEKFVEYFFDDFVETNLTGAENEGLKSIVEAIASNIPNVDSFEKEFSNLDMLFDNVNNTDKTTIALTFDKIKLTNSKLITQTNMHQMVAYFFDEYVSKNLDADQDADLISIVNGLKENIKDIVVYKTEFDNLELLFDSVNNSDTAEIGAILDQIAQDDSKLIKKDPNMFEIVTYFFDKYVEENLDAQDDAELIEIIKGIKANVSSIESFETEFNHLETLLNQAKESDTKAMGATLDSIADSGSKLIKKSNMFEIVTYFFDKYVDENLDSQNDAELIDIIKGIKSNVSSIESFEIEFNHLETLLNQAKDTSADTKDMGAVLDSIANSNSKLIKKDPNMFEIVTYFFDKFIGEKLDADQDSELIEIVNGIKQNVSLIDSFEVEFDHLETLLNQAKDNDTKKMGAVLDSIANSNSKLIKKDPNMFEIVKYFFDKYVDENLNAQDDAELIEIIKDIKENVSSIESFETEFNHLETLLNQAKESNTKAMGATLDSIANSGSKLIKKSNMFEIVTYFFDEFIGEKLDADQDAELITIVNGIKKNVNKIQSFALEFDYLELLLQSVEYTDKKEIGKVFDKIVREDSKLIRKNPNLNNLVGYFFTDYVENNLDAEDDANLISIINGIKSNISYITSFEFEFGNLDLLFNNVNNSDLKVIGNIFDQLETTNSLLIKRNPNINALVSYFFEDYIANNLNAEEDADLIEIVRDMKSNIPQVESFALEFENLENLFDKVNSSATKTEIGAYFDELIQKDSKLIKRDPNLNSLVGYYFDDYIENNLDKTQDAKLIEIIDDIKDNISSIQSFEFEFGNLDLLFNNINSSDLDAIGKVFDQLENADSKLIRRDPNINALVAYFFDDYTANNLDAEEDKSLIVVVKGMKKNISSVESFETEFGYIETLFDKVKNSTKTEIGSYLDSLVTNDSKLIRKDPNMFNLVTCLFDDYVSNNLDSTNDKDLIEIINDIKTNVSSIESFEFEFSNLDLLFDVVKSSSKTEIGKTFDQLKASNSKLIKEDPNIRALVTYFFDDYVSSNLDSTEDKDLIGIVNNIKQNISAIASYEVEFEYLDLLFGVLTSSDMIKIGETLDEINGNSKLISSDNIKQIVEYFFDSNTSEYRTDYDQTISKMRAKVGGASNYKDTFNELETIMSNLDTLATLNSVESFKNSQDVGQMLDNMAEMTQACDKTVAYSISKTVFDEFLTCVENEYPAIVKTQIEDLMNNETFSFNTYDPSDSVEYAGSHADEDYYKDLVGAIKDALPSF